MCTHVPYIYYVRLHYIGEYIVVYTYTFNINLSSSFFFLVIIMLPCKYRIEQLDLISVAGHSDTTNSSMVDCNGRFKQKQQTFNVRI